MNSANFQFIKFCQIFFLSLKYKHIKNLHAHVYLVEYIQVFFRFFWNFESSFQFFEIKGLFFAWDLHISHSSYH
jgi:hypothetical protein